MLLVLKYIRSVAGGSGNYERLDNQRALANGKALPLLLHPSYGVFTLDAVLRGAGCSVNAVLSLKVHSD